MLPKVRNCVSGDTREVNGMERKHKDAIAIVLVVVIIIAAIALMYNYVHQDDQEFPYGVHIEKNDEFAGTQYFGAESEDSARIDGFVVIYETEDGYAGDISFIAHTDALLDVEIAVDVDPAFVVDKLTTNYPHVNAYTWNKDGNTLKFEADWVPVPAGEYFANIHMIWSGEGADDGEFTFRVYVPYDDMYVTVTVPSE